MTPVFERTREQQIASLKIANKIRASRAKLKQQVRDGEVSVGTILRDPPDYVATMHVAKLLGAVRKLGPSKIRQVMISCRIAPGKTVGGLSDRQRGELAKRLDHWHLTAATSVCQDDALTG